MKKIFLVILIALGCVVGGLGLVIGGMYLFGGFNEKIVYATDLSFNKKEVVSAESIFLQLNTSTEGVTRKSVRLVVSRGGESIINFPEYVNIGETFRIIPKQDSNGVNVGGNVKITATYDNRDANVGVRAECNILVDIPVKKASVNLSTNKLRVDQQIRICEEGCPITDTFTIEPLNSLVPHIKNEKPASSSSSQTATPIIDKAIYLKLESVSGAPIQDVAKFIVDGNVYNSNMIEVKYTYNQSDRKIYCANTISLKAGSLTSDAKLNVYVYPTYKEQEKNVVGSSIVLNENQAVNTITDFLVGGYEIDELTIFEDDNIVETPVLLNKEVRIYLNNTHVTNGDINLNLNLNANASQSAHIGNLEYKNNVYLNITGEDYISLSKADGTVTPNGDWGLNIDCDGIGDQLSNWYWKLKISDFRAYYEYLTTSKMLTATLSYFDGTTYAPPKQFRIVPSINEVDTLTPNYKSESAESFKIRSGENLNISSNDVSITAKGVESPTFNTIAFYLDYAENSNGGVSTIKTIPTQRGDYKATFFFKFNREIEESELSNINVTCSESWITIDQSKNLFRLENIEGLCYGELYVNITSTTTDDILFYVNLDDGVTSASITSFMVKFYEKTESGSYKETPYLSVGGIRYNVNFDFYADSLNNKYLKIDTDINGETFVSGIGSFKITAQLVYEDHENNITYWLGKKTNLKIDIYEELSSLFAYSYKNQDEYNLKFSTEAYDENDTNTYHIFITSNEIEALKNYIAYGQVNITFKQYFKDINTDEYIGIYDVNKFALTIGDRFIEVIKDNVVIGYIISYEINNIDTILINGNFLDNIFRMEISIEVNDVVVYASFALDTNTTTDYLDINITNHIITEAVLEYNTSGNTGSTIEDAIELRATAPNGVFTYGSNLDRYLKYYFKYNASDTVGTLDSLSYDLTVLANSQGITPRINLTDLYSFVVTYGDNLENYGLGGLEFRNFPIVYDENGHSEGVLLEFTIFSNDPEVNKYAFNTHYEYINNMFIRTINDNLTASLYFRIFGAEIEITAKDELEFIGYEGNEVMVLSESNAVDSIFNIKVKSGDGANLLEISDYTQLFTAVAGSDYVKFEELNGKPNYSKLIITKDCIAESDISFMFYIGSQVDANKIKIKQGDSAGFDFYQTISPAYNIDLTTAFESPSENNEVVRITYNKPNEENTINNLDVSIIVPETLPTFIGISSRIIVKSAEGNLLKFITVPEAYSVRLKLAITKTYADSTRSNYEREFTINVLPRFEENDFIIGTLNSETNKREIDAGIDNYSNYEDELLVEKAKITGSSVLFEDVDNDCPILVANHMSYSYVSSQTDPEYRKVRISSTDLNFNKEIKARITLRFSDGGAFIFNKNIVVKGNISLQFKDEYRVRDISDGSDTMNLINWEFYTLRINGEDCTERVLGEDIFPMFDYNNTTAIYNKNSFVFGKHNGVDIFEDVTAGAYQNGQYFHIRVRYEAFEKDTQIQTIIKFKYVVEERYTLVLEMPVTINIRGVVELDLKTENKTLNITNRSEAINYMDSNLYNFTIGGVNSIARFNSEILAYYDHNNLESKYNKTNFTYDSNIFEDVTELDDAANKNKKMLLAVRFNNLLLGSTISTQIKFVYEGQTRTVEFTFNITINVSGTPFLDLKVENKNLTITASSNAINFVDANLYSFAIDGVISNDRFRSEVIDNFVYDGPDSGYNINSFEYDGNVFENVTTSDDLTENDSKVLLLRVKHSNFTTNQIINTQVKFYYKTASGPVEFTFNITITIQ